MDPQARRELYFSRYLQCSNSKKDRIMRFAGKRKAKVIKVADEDETSENVSASSGENATSDGEYSQTLNMRRLLMRPRLTLASTESAKPLFGAKSGRKPFRQSGVRKSFNPADGDRKSVVRERV